MVSEDSNVNVQNPPLQEVRPSHKKTFIITVLFFLLILLIAATFFAKNFNHKLIENNKQVTESQTPSIQPSQSEIEKMVVKKKPSVELYMDIKNQLIKIFKEQ